MWIILSFTDNEETANHKTIAAFNPAYEKLNKRKLINAAKHAQARDGQSPADAARVCDLFDGSR